MNGFSINKEWCEYLEERKGKLFELVNEQIRMYGVAKIVLTYNNDWKEFELKNHVITANVRYCGDLLSIFSSNNGYFRTAFRDKETFMPQKIFVYEFSTMGMEFDS